MTAEQERCSVQCSISIGWQCAWLGEGERTSVRLASKFLEHLRREGAWRALCRVPRSLCWRFLRYWDDTRFDRKYAVETSRIESEYLQSINSQFVAVSEFYEATKWRHFHRIMRALPINHADFVFVDAGCGKGRVLMFASFFKFRKIVGVEFSDQLVEVARRNMARFSAGARSRPAVEIHCRDIALFDLPKANLLIYLYNPFRAELMKLFIDKIGQFIANNPFHVYIAYRNPVCAEMFAEQPFLEVLERKKAFSIYRARRSLLAAIFGVVGAGIEPSGIDDIPVRLDYLPGYEYRIRAA